MYGIEVYSKKGYGELTDQEWSEIKAAIGNWMIENEDGTVYVEPMDADKTIRALNAIGFTTDEDYLVDPDDETPALATDNHGFEQWQLEQLPLGLVAKANGRWCQATHYGVLDDSEDRLVIEAGNDGLPTDYSSDFDNLAGLLSAMADFAPPAAWVEYGLDDGNDDPA